MQKWALLSLTPKSPFCGREGLSWGSVVHKTSLIKAKGQSKSDESNTRKKKRLWPHLNTLNNIIQPLFC